MSRFLLAGLAPLSILCLAGVASANPTVPGLSPLPKTLPDRCVPLAAVPASAQIPGPELSAHVSVANCLLEVAMNGVTLSSDDPSIKDLNTAVTPGLAVLDNVISVGDPYWKMIATDAKHDLYISMVVRARSSLTGADMRTRDALERRLVPWLDAASSTNVAFMKLAAGNAELARRDEVIRNIVAREATQLRPVE